MRDIKDNAFYDYVASQLHQAQKVAIRRHLNGGCSHRALAPSLQLTMAELREHTDRKRIKRAYLDILAAELENRGLCVLLKEERVIITKPYVSRHVDFTTLKELVGHVDKHLVKKRVSRVHRFS